MVEHPASGSSPPPATSGELLVADPPSCEEQRSVYKRMINVPESSMRVGDRWYLVEARWMRKWKAFVNYNADPHPGPAVPPGPIDNQLLLDAATGQLRRNLIKGVDFSTVPEDLWTALVAWYRGGPAIPRMIIVRGAAQYKEAEVYPPTVQVVHHGRRVVGATSADFRDNTHHPMVVSEMTPLKSFIALVKQHLRLDGQPRVYLFDGHTRGRALDDDESTMEEIGIDHNRVVLFETLNSHGSWGAGSTAGTSSALTVVRSLNDDDDDDDDADADPSDAFRGGSRAHSAAIDTDVIMRDSSAARSSAGVGARAPPISPGGTVGSGKSAGLVGLSNIGNTCFMNSALQCMSNAEPLTRYFLSGRWRSEVNTVNPIGTAGQAVVREYAKLMYDMWCSGRGTVTPRDFKYAIGRHRPQFLGYQQQDAQELLQQLLDALHEDLNRVLKKPYVEAVEGKPGDDDAELGAEAWRRHLQRNDSVIVDTFHGQLKSELVCPDCGNVAIKFDPFAFVTVPVPVPTDRTMEVFFVPISSTWEATKYSVTLPKRAEMSVLKAALHELTNVDPKFMVVTEVFSNHVYRLYSDTNTIKAVRDNDTLVVYEVAHAVHVTQRDRYSTPVLSGAKLFKLYSRTKKPSAHGYTSGYVTAHGYPLVFTWPDDTDASYAALCEYVCTRLHGYFADGDEDRAADYVTDEEGEAVAFKSTAAFHLHRVDAHTSRYVDPTVTTPHAAGAVVDMGPPGRPAKMANLALDWADFMAPLLAPYELAKAHTHASAEIGGGGGGSGEGKRGAITLEQCFDLFSKREVLGEDDQWYCGKCKNHVSASKKMDLWRMPDVLIVALKRFVYTRHYRDKISAFVEYPETLDLRKHMAGPARDGKQPVYRLFAVSNHGGGLGGGHYTAYGRNINDGKWYHFDDSYVSSADPQRVVSPAGYVLFYKRVE